MSIKKRTLALSALLIAVAGALAACSPARLVNALTPTSGLTKTANFSYLPGNNSRQLLDVYQPAVGGETTQSRPVVIFFYGGAWQEGSRDDYLFVADALTQRGYVVVIPDYRVFPEVMYPDFLGDGAAAVAWTAANIDRFGGDRSRLFLMGHSAGAHMAAMLALDRSYLVNRNVPATSIRGLIGLAGPYDFLPLTEPNVIALFSTEKNLAMTQPISYVKPAEAASIPPVLLLHGDADTRVYPKNSINLTRELRAAGAKVEFELLPGIDHTSIIAKFTRLLRGDGKVVDRVDQFIREKAAG